MKVNLQFSQSIICGFHQVLLPKSFDFYTPLSNLIGGQTKKESVIISELKRFYMKIISHKIIFTIIFVIITLTFQGFLSFRSLAAPNAEYASPSNRYGHDMIFDSDNARFILYGGAINSEGVSTWHSNETWTYIPETRTWNQIPTLSNPGFIAHHSMVYDSFHRKIICFGGLSESSDTLNETWIFDCDTNEWVEVFPPTSPAARSDPSMYYDVINGKIVLFGGYGGDSLSYLDDLWIFDVTANSWTEKQPSSSPPASYGHNMIYDSVNGQGILFGGRTSGGVHNDIWTYHYINNSWTIQEQPLKPTTRYWHTMLFDPINNQVVVFGGRQSQFFTSPVLKDTWSYHPEENNWIEYNSSQVPPSSSSRFIYDSINQKALLFGGVSSVSPLIYCNETWEFNCQNYKWTLVASPLIDTSTSESYPQTSTETTDLTLNVFFLLILPLYSLNKRKRVRAD